MQQGNSDQPRNFNRKGEQNDRNKKAYFKKKDNYKNYGNSNNDGSQSQNHNQNKNQDSNDGFPPYQSKNSGNASRPQDTIQPGTYVQYAPKVPQNYGNSDQDDFN